MGPFVTAVTPDDAPRVDMSKPTVRVLGTYVPSVGDRVHLSPSTPCALMFDDSGRGCRMPFGHDTTVIPHASVGFREYGESGDYTSDVYEVMSVAPLYVPPTESEVADLRRRVESEKRRADASERTIEDIRLYVLERRSDGDICDAGTLRFLKHFGMEAWEQDFTVDVTISVTANGFLTGEQAADYVRNRMLRQCDDDRMTVDDVSVNNVTDEEGDSVDY